MSTYESYNMNSLENLLKRESYFDPIPEPEQKDYTTSTLMRANGNASLLDFFDMVSLIITNTLDDLHVDCMPDEKAYVLTNDPVEVINHPIVTFKVNERVHKDGYSYKPKLIETVTEHESGKTAFIYSERYTSKVQFNIMASEYRLAWTIMERIEDVLLSYAETIKGNGIVEYYFNKQYYDKYYDTFRNTLTVLNLEYCVETEKLRVIFKENIKDIITKEYVEDSSTSDNQN
jgi:hypothetical protein